MLIDVVGFDILDDYKLKVRFDNGVEGIVDISELVPFEGVFAPLNDINYFRKVALYEEGGTIFWPNGADLDPDVLYSVISGEEIPDFQALPSGTEPE
jgi:hypothetical protein